MDTSDTSPSSTQKNEVAVMFIQSIEIVIKNLDMAMYFGSKFEDSELRQEIGMLCADFIATFDFKIRPKIEIE